jgi:DnaJ family protein A protein 2
VLGVVLGV